jgi:hypothetical protein
MSICNNQYGMTDSLIHVCRGRAYHRPYQFWKDGSLKYDVIQLKMTYLTCTTKRSMFRTACVPRMSPPFLPGDGLTTACVEVERCVFLAHRSIEVEGFTVNSRAAR